MEPPVAFLTNPQFSGTVFGIFLAFFILFIIAIRGREYETFWFLIAPAVGGTVGYAIHRYVHTLIHYILLLFDFPMSFVEICLYTQFINYIARAVIRQDEKRENTYKGLIALISMPTLVFSFYIISYDFKPENFTFIHGLSFGAFGFCFLYSIIADNGTIVDSSLMLLKACLVLAPTLSQGTSSTPNYTNITRVVRLLTCVISIISYNFKYDEREVRLKVLEVFIRNLNENCITNLCISFTFMFFSYILISEKSFIVIQKPFSDLQALIIPLVFMFYLLNEAIYYHVYKTPATQK